MTIDTQAPQDTAIPDPNLLAAIVDSSDDAILSKTLDGVITSWNRAAERIFGYTAQEVIGKSITILLPPERLHEEVDILKRLRRGERTENFETVRVRKDGRHIEVSVTSSPVRDESGRIVGASKIVRDTSKSHATERALHTSETRLAGIVDSAMDAIITVDDGGHIVLFNEAAATMFGCDGAKMIGESLERLMPGPHFAGHLSAMTRFGDSGTTRRSMGRAGEIVALRSDGTQFPVEASISHVEIEGHQLFTVIMRDVSATRRAQAERHALEAQLREAQKMEAVGTLAGGIAHDFNNIMGSIIGNVRLALLDLSLDHSARASLAQIDRAATRARNVVRQILTFGRRQPQELKMQPLRPLLEEVLSLLHATVPSVVRLEPSLAEEPIQALIDTTQMHQVLINLCTNAWHALQGSTGRIQIGLELLQLDANEAVRIGTMAAGPHAHIWVIDNGCGMDAATKARIFEPFFTTKAAGEGTGLGLSVVHGIVADHHGAITVDSSPGKGSAFHLYFPAQSGTASGTSPEEPEAAFAPAGNGQRVVYIDDDEVMRLMVGRLLERSGFQPTCHQAASAALAAIRAQPQGCDVVVTDFNMPEFSGIDVAAALATLRPDLPVIISSGYISDELRASAAQWGVKALLAKEDTFEDLAGLILQVLESR